MRTLLLCFILLLTACPKNKPEVPKVDPVKAEEAALVKLRADHQSKITKDSPETAASLIYLEIDAQARYALYQQEKPDEAKQPLSPEAIALRMEIGKYLSELKKKKLHLSPVQYSNPIVGLTPLGIEINRITTNVFLASSNPTTQPGKMQGKIDILRVFYDGSRPLDVTRKKPAPKELPELSVLGVDVCDGILEIYSAPNFSELSGLKQDKKLISGYKRNITLNRKQFAKFAGLPDLKAPDPKDPKDPKNPKDPKGTKPPKDTKGTK